MILDANIILIDMPHSIKAYTVANKDMSYTIVINARLSHENQLKSYKHELEHINNGDYERKCSVDLIELFSHK